MGLTIHYSLHSDSRNPRDARRRVEQLQQAARDLPFDEVRDIVDVSGDDLDWNGMEISEGRRWLLVQATRWFEHEGGFRQVDPLHVIAFSTSPGPGCEAANFGLCRYPPAVEVEGRSVPSNLDGWNWRSFCKTQYASNPEDGGVENFLRCHLTLVKLLDRARELNLLAEVSDEGGFWEHRNVVALAETVGRWNRHLAGFVGRFKDWYGDDIVAPITDYPDFEHLEADGLKGDPGDTPRR